MPLLPALEDLEALPFPKAFLPELAQLLEQAPFPALRLLDPYGLPPEERLGFYLGLSQLPPGLYHHPPQCPPHTGGTGSARPPDSRGRLLRPQPSKGAPGFGRVHPNYLEGNPESLEGGMKPWRYGLGMLVLTVPSEAFGTFLIYFYLGPPCGGLRLLADPLRDLGRGERSPFRPPFRPNPDPPGPPQTLDARKPPHLGTPLFRRLHPPGGSTGRRASFRLLPPCNLPLWGVRIHPLDELLGPLARALQRPKGADPGQRRQASLPGGGACDRDRACPLGLRHLRVFQHGLGPRRFGGRSSPLFPPRP